MYIIPLTYLVYYEDIKVIEKNMDRGTPGLMCSQLPKCRTVVEVNGSERFLLSALRVRRRSLVFLQLGWKSTGGLFLMGGAMVDRRYPPRAPRCSQLRCRAQYA